MGDDHDGFDGIDGIDGFDDIDDATLSRRRLMKRMGAAGAIAWAAPAMTRMSPAGASTGGSPFSPAPECVGATCGTFTVCSTNDRCICVQSASGGGLCISGETACSSLDVCGPGNTCPPGFVCAVNTCCTGAVCVPLDSDQCPPLAAGGSARTSGARVRAGAGTIGG